MLFYPSFFMSELVEENLVHIFNYFTSCFWISGLICKGIFLRLKSLSSTREVGFSATWSRKALF